MSTETHKDQRVLEEGVIMILDEKGVPEAIARRDHTDGELKLYKVTPLRFGDVKDFLLSLIKQPLIKHDRQNISETVA